MKGVGEHSKFRNRGQGLRQKHTWCASRRESKPVKPPVRGPRTLASVLLFAVAYLPPALRSAWQLPVVVHCDISTLSTSTIWPQCLLSGEII